MCQLFLHVYDWLETKLTRLDPWNMKYYLSSLNRASNKFADNFLGRAAFHSIKEEPETQKIICLRLQFINDKTRIPAHA